MQFTEHRSRAQGLADLLLYDSLIDDGVVLLQDGALMAAWTFRGRTWLPRPTGKWLPSVPASTLS